MCACDWVSEVAQSCPTLQSRVHIVFFQYLCKILGNGCFKCQFLCWLFVCCVVAHEDFSLRISCILRFFAHYGHLNTFFISFSYSKGASFSIRMLLVWHNIYIFVAGKSIYLVVGRRPISQWGLPQRIIWCKFECEYVSLWWKSNNLVYSWFLDLYANKLTPLPHP